MPQKLDALKCRGHPSAAPAVTLDIDGEPVRIENVWVSPVANISTNAQFQPLRGTHAAVVVDFSMTANEVNPAVTLMLNQLVRLFPGMPV